MTFTIALVVVLVLAAVALMPKKSADQSVGNGLRQQFAYADPVRVESPTPVIQRSLREMQLAEEAEAIASVYRTKSQSAWLAKITKDAADLLIAPEVK